jgi:FixJ family two-component response regulator
MKPIIFYVDDEPMNLTVFEAGLPADWDIRTFDNPATALAEMRQIKPWVVVSDQRMPGMKGVDFLDKVRQISPESVRIIATGFSDEQLIIESVRRAKIFDYIRKPWDSDDLQSRLELAIQQYRITNLPQQNSRLSDAVTTLQTQKVNLSSALGIARLTIDPLTALVSLDAASTRLLLASLNGEELTNVKSSMFFDDIDFKEFSHQLSVTASGSIVRQMIRGASASGSNRWFLIHGRKLTEADSLIYECMVVEVTSMKLAEDKIVRHSEEISKTNDYLTEFANYLSVAAADPIRNLSNYLELISDQNEVRNNPSLNELVNRAQDCAHGLKRSMQIIYRLSKVSFAKLELETVSLDAIFAKLLHEQEIVRNMEISISSAGLPTVWGDNDLVFQLLSNILTSVRLGGGNSISILPSSDSTHEKIEFSFQNIPISDEDISSAFSMSSYSEIGPSRPIDRAALILAKTIAERMNGAISLNRCGVNGLNILLKLAKATSKRSRSSLRLIA